MSKSESDAVADALPDLADFTDPDVVIYDGQCPFCCRQVRRLAAWDGGRRLAFLSLHDPRTAERYPELSPHQLMDQMHVVDRRGRIHGGAGAIRYLSRRLPRLWPVAPALHLPFSLVFWQWLYRLVARLRYGRHRERCDDHTCGQIHSGGKST